MDQVPRPWPALKDLMSLIGYFLFHWGVLERKVIDTIGCLEGMSKSSTKPLSTGFGKRLDQWRELHLSVAPEHEWFAGEVDTLFKGLRESTKTRNIICHGMLSATAAPEAGEPRIDCTVISSGMMAEARKQPSASFSFRELEREIAKLENYRGELNKLSQCALEISRMRGIGRQRDHGQRARKKPSQKTGSVRRDAGEKGHGKRVR